MSRSTPDNDAFIHSVQATTTAFSTVEQKVQQHDSLVDNYVEQLLIGDPAMGLKETGTNVETTAASFLFVADDMALPV